MVALLEFLWALTTNPWINQLALISLFLPVIATLIIVWVSCYRFTWLAPIFMGINFFISCITLLATYQGNTFLQYYCWFSLPSHAFNLSIYIDAVTAIMGFMVTLLSFLIFAYSIPYLAQHAAYKRYWGLMHLFVGAMLGLILSNHLIGVFLFWELMGIASYLLIGLEYQQSTSARASAQTWLISKLGSVLLLAGFILLGCACNTFELSSLIHLNIASIANKSQLSLAGICMVLGICIKSAQFPFFDWLPHAMTAPTPASALLHAATLVSAGIYVLLRINHLLPAELLIILTFVGSLTAFLGATAALTQADLKRMLAYSTISQLGYLVMALGMQANFAAFIHLLTHAFLKACLFLCAGAMAFFMHATQRQKHQTYLITQLGGYRQWMPIIYPAYILASLALVGLPGFTSAFSKERILTTGFLWAIKHAPATHAWSYLVPLFSWAATICTLVYIGRSCITIFTSTPTQQPFSNPSLKSYQRTIPFWMQLSILLLALCTSSLPYQLLLNLSGLQKLSYTVTSLIADQTYFFKQPQLASYMATFSFFVGGIILWLISRPSQLIKSIHIPQLYKLTHNGWYVGAMIRFTAQQIHSLSYLVARIDFYIIQGSIYYLATSYVVLAHIIAWLDQKVIGGIIRLITNILRQLSRLYGNLQKGNIQHYLWWTGIGTALIVAYWWLYRF